jgi:hypothetical protein
VTTPRAIGLLRVPDLQTLHDLIARAAGPVIGRVASPVIARVTDEADPIAARDCAVIVPTRGAAEALRRTLENRALAAPGAVAVLPDILTRGDF